MRILVADDDAVTLKLLAETVARLGHQVTTATDGRQALDVLDGDDPPPLALLDWIMPVFNGPEICRTLRGRLDQPLATYVILVTARSRSADVVEGLKAGANDYVTKPFDVDEISVRIDLGIRWACLERKLRSRTREVEELTRRLDETERLLPMCPGCRQRRTDERYWTSVMMRMEDGRQREPSCPECVGALVLK